MLSLTQCATRLGSYRYIELALFELCGARSHGASRSDLAVFFSTASAAHAWRAELFEPLMPVSVGLEGVASLTRSPSDDVTAILDELGGISSDEELFLAMIEVVLPASRAGYLAHLERCTPVADGTVIRALRRGLFDIEMVLEEAARVGEVAPAPSQLPKSRLVEQIVAVGGIFGPWLGDA